MPDEIRKRFSRTAVMGFNIKESYEAVMNSGGKSKMVLEHSLLQHAQMCIENAVNLLEAYELSGLLKEDITYRIKQYSYCIMKSSDNYLKWLEEDYQRQLKVKIAQKYRP